jgi:hypothetical protein
MRSARFVAAFGLLLLAVPTGTIAATPHGPSSQQVQCAAAGGSFAVGYEADTYVCVSGEGRSVQTCRFGSDPGCSTEEAPRKKAGRQDQGQSSFGLF